MNISLTLNINIQLDPKTGQASVTVDPLPQAQPDQVPQNQTPPIAKVVQRAAVRRASSSAAPQFTETKAVDIWSTHGAHEPQKDPDKISFDLQDQMNQLNQLKVPEAYGEQIPIVPLKTWDVEIATLWKDFAKSFQDADPADRGSLMQNLAGHHNHWKVLQHIVAYGGLQLSLVYGLQLSEKQAEDLANLMVQISHSCLPDLARTLDYSSVWRRTCANFYSSSIQG